MGCWRVLSEVESLRVLSEVGCWRVLSEVESLRVL